MAIDISFYRICRLQYNDPDPWLWGPIYLYAAWLCFSAGRGKYFPKFYLGGIAFYLVYAFYLFVDKNGVWNWATRHNAENLVQTMKAERPWIEETREFGGLLIVTGALLLNYLKYRKTASI
ncbi:transmembrane 220 family protein [Flavihumibacter profundi]|uniref:transmembrane 220 family protein n=1 Tax=Flavihumibacter profundi TaxID=2716883 RepID=UPI001CC82926|nr:transmembrane 220 family protein [Flavihumibacter profundi]MBZ5856462.1 transmembrane 220 family protein [Flavihumibacter profundi]